MTDFDATLILSPGSYSDGTKTTVQLQNRLDVCPKQSRKHSHIWDASEPLSGTSGETRTFYFGANQDFTVPNKEISK